MKETIKTSRTAGFLEKIFRELNTDYFDDQLDMPIITIQNTPRAYGHVTAYKEWSNKHGEKQHELNIGAGTLNRPIENVVSTMMHEMCHLWNMQNGIQDTSRGGAYHNKKFKESAEARDLIIDHDPTIGFSITSPSEKLISYIIDKGWEDIAMNRDGIGFSFGIGGNGGNRGNAPTVTKKPTSTRKYQCPHCKNSVRATKALNIICGDCMELMVLA